MLIPLHSDADHDALVSFLSSNRFPFHVTESMTPLDAHDRVERGDYVGPENEPYWINLPEIGIVGLIVFHEVTDGTPLIDLRISDEHRGRGIGTAALRCGTRALFEAHPEVLRIEGNTRVDNTAMRRAFASAGYVKEAHYRDGWSVAGGASLDSVAYAILRRDWVNGVTTPVAWDS